jgi:hypothetical protein
MLFKSILIEGYLCSMIKLIVNNINLLFSLISIFINTMSRLLLKLIKTSKTLLLFCLILLYLQ